MYDNLDLVEFYTLIKKYDILASDYFEKICKMENEGIVYDYYHRKLAKRFYKLLIKILDPEYQIVFKNAKKEVEKQKYIFMQNTGWLVNHDYCYTVMDYGKSDQAHLLYLYRDNDGYHPSVDGDEFDIKQEEAFLNLYKESLDKIHNLYLIRENIATNIRYYLNNPEKDLAIAKFVVKYLDISAPKPKEYIEEVLSLKKVKKNGV